MVLRRPSIRPDTSKARGPGDGPADHSVIALRAPSALRPASGPPLNRWAACQLRQLGLKLLGAENMRAIRSPPLDCR
jgi:hypothetical protein